MYGPTLRRITRLSPTRFLSHIFDYIVYEHSSDEESVHSIDSSVSEFYSDDSTYFSEIFYTLLCIFYATPNFTTRTGTGRYKKRPPVENDRRPVPAFGRLFNFPKAPAFGKGFYSFSPLSRRPLVHLAKKQPALKKGLAIPAN